ncbi:MAG TPA: isoprenylcysteine carboxylmethyltransferase family protein [Actinomycetota bacterium]|jgi:protein-S-isoprenylcysteine O-methyltransferase Ste14
MSTKVEHRVVSGHGSLKTLIGAGDRIALFTLPFLVVGLVLNLTVPFLFAVGGPPAGLRTISIAILIVGMVVWVWSAALILRKVPRGELITGGPFHVVKHPLYTGVALLVLPWLGLLLNTWLGAAIGIVLYMGCRMFAPAEEAELSTTFGQRWNDYLDTVLLPWV